MKQSAVEWLVEELKGVYESDYLNKLIEQAKQMERKQKLEKQLFIGKVVEIIGDDKTLELLRESKQAIEKI